jgi:pilus assembly protein Flp/PilA
MITHVRSIFSAAKSDRGASAVEYGILVAAIAAVIVAVVFVIGGQVKSGFDTTCTNLAAHPATVGAGCPAP